MNPVECCDAAFKRTVLLACYDALENAGFTRFRKENVDWPLGNGFHCWIGLNNDLKKEYFQINPFVGIHAAPLERFWTSLKSSGKYPAKYERAHATYALHLGGLAPEEGVFRFTHQTAIEEEAQRLARLYMTVGLSYARSIASYERLLPLLQERVPMLGAYPERVAACLYLMDRKEEARNFVEDFLKTHREYFEGFAVPFLKRLTH